MSLVELRYLASREWMESEILAGRAVSDRRQSLTVEIDDLDSRLAERVEAIDDGALFFELGGETRVCVLDSGVDPEISFGPDRDSLVPFDKPIVDKIGPLPELPGPTEDVAEVADAWEEWDKRYREVALSEMERLSADPPAVGQAFGGETRHWGTRLLLFGNGYKPEIELKDGITAIRDARAGTLWKWAAERRFSAEALVAAKEATMISPSEVRSLLAAQEPAEMARTYLIHRRKLHRTAKAFDAARSKAPAFDAEMKDWADKQGSERLRLGLEDGYRMNSRYLAERIAAEAPGMFAMPANSTPSDWASRATSPSRAALLLRRRIEAAMKKSAPLGSGEEPEVDIMIVKKPPHEIYLADPGVEVGHNQVVGRDLPSREGWPWFVGQAGPVHVAPTPFEAVVVKNWLGRFHLIGAVKDDAESAKGIWATPDIERYGEDGTVAAMDPDDPAPSAAKRKPPDPQEADDIPF